MANSGDDGIAGGLPQSRLDPQPYEPPPEPPPPSPPPAPPPAPPAPPPPQPGLPDPASWSGSYVNAAQVQDFIDLGYDAAMVLAWQRAVNESLAARGVLPPSSHEPEPGGGGPGPSVPPAAGGGAGGTVGDRSSPLEPEDGPALDTSSRSLQSAAGQILRGAAFVDAVFDAADFYNIDPLASFANALAEGAQGAVGDQGVAYGPWQIHATDGRLRSFASLRDPSPVVQAWAWSRDGVDYAHRSMVAGHAAGLSGAAAVHAIVYGFERPRDMAGADSDRRGRYERLKAMGDGVRAFLIGQFAGPTSGSIGNATPTAAGADTGGGGDFTPVDASGSVAAAWSDLQRTVALDWLGYAGTIRDETRRLDAAVN